MTAKDSRDRRAYHFERRMKAAREGVHLPSEVELLHGMAFYQDDISQDMREYAERLARRVRKRERAALAPLTACLDELAVEQSEDAVRRIEPALDTAKGVKGIPIDACRLRCRIWLATLGDAQSAAMVAAETAALALSDIEDANLVSRALGWAAFAQWLGRTREMGLSPASDMLPKKLDSHVLDFRSAIERFGSRDDPAQHHDSAVAALAEVTEEERPKGTPEGIIVIASIGNDTTAEGKRVVKEFEKFVQRRLPLPNAPDLAVVRTRLTTEFPWGASVADEILNGLVGKEHVRLRPTILLGPPGCGKTRFARRLIEELETPYELVPCGGLSDSAIGGTARRWSSGEPSLAVMALRRHKCAGPALILDEIEKIGTGRHNGNVHDVLLGLLERETSSRWFDPYIQANCDLSHLTWLMTANEIGSVPAMLRDRCHVLPFPEPGPEHLPLLASRILERFYLEQGHDPRWATPLEGFEIEALARVWRGGSIRKLERLIEKLLAVRDRLRTRH